MNHHSESLPSKESSSKANLQNEVISRKNKRSLQQRRSRAAWILVAPALILLASVAGWPLLRTLFYSFTDAALDTPEEYNLVGFDNYLSWADGESFGVLADPLWWKAVMNTLWFTGVSVSFELFFGMLLALLMNQKFRGQGLVRAAILVPWAIAAIMMTSVGSMTPAGMTAAAIVLPMMPDLGLSSLAAVLAIGSGTLMGNHYNNSGFWVMGQFFHLNTKQSVKYVTVPCAVASVICLIAVVILNAVGVFG